MDKNSVVTMLNNLLLHHKNVPYGFTDFTIIPAYIMLIKLTVIDFFFSWYNIIQNTKQQHQIWFKLRHY